MDVTSVHPSGTPISAVTEVSQPKWLAENQELIRSVKSINASELFGDNTELTFALDRQTQKPVVRVVNSQTQEILWQEPPEYLLRLAQAFGQNTG